MKEILKIIDLKERENYIYKHGVYYIGEFKNNERNGMGKEYYPNGKLLFGGNFVDGIYEGKGKYIDKNDQFFMAGDFKNDFIIKGKVYFPNGKLNYEGEFKNNAKDGKGKEYFEDGTYYIGEFENNKIHGKGK